MTDTITLEALARFHDRDYVNHTDPTAGSSPAGDFLRMTASYIDTLDAEIVRLTDERDTLGDWHDIRFEALEKQQAEIARLTAERDAAVEEQVRLETAWYAKHEQQVADNKNNREYFDKSQRRMIELCKERDAADERGAERMRERARQLVRECLKEWSERDYVSADYFRGLEHASDEIFAAICTLPLRETKQEN